ncbi:hypothetical protein FOZ63_016550, partial [Perkinsus olseni]
ADDGVILFRNQDVASIQTSVNAISRKLDLWCLSTKCRLSWAKTRLMCFPAKRVHGGQGVEVRIGDCHITEDRVNCLGMCLDRKFRWGPHVASLMSRIEGGYHSVKMHVRNTWGLLPEVAIRLLDTIARGHLLHGVACWGTAL